MFVHLRGSVYWIYLIALPTHTADMVSVLPYCFCPPISSSQCKVVVRNLTLHSAHWTMAVTYVYCSRLYAMLCPLLAAYIFLLVGKELPMHLADKCTVKYCFDAHI